MNFTDQYKHPLWQKKRLEALEAAEFMCQRCYDTESQLHVHHKCYVKDRRVWEYKTSELSVLCESCHEETHAVKDMLWEILLALHPEGYTELVSIIAAYCHAAAGPIGADLSNVIERLNDPYGHAVGTLAAKMANLFLGVPAMLDLVKQLEDARPGGVVTIAIPHRPSLVECGGVI